MAQPYRMTKSERLARRNLSRLMWENRQDVLTMNYDKEIPDAWHRLEADLDCFEKKEKVTLYLEKSVARFYKSMGTGYQARINRILATWAQMKIGEFLDMQSRVDADATDILARERLAREAGQTSPGTDDYVDLWPEEEA